MIQCNAVLLQLFLAKKDGVWLTEADVKKGVSDTSGLKPMDLAGAPLNSVDLSEEDVQIQLTMDEIKAGKVPVHVLVVVPEHNKVRSCAEVLLGVILRYMILHIPTTETEPNIDFKDQLCEFYGCFSQRKSWVRCMPLDIEIPEALVIASYLFRRSNEFLAFMKIPDIDDVRNGLLLFKPLKYAFDRLQISFILDETDVFRLKLFDPNIRNTRLIDLRDGKGNKVLSAEELGVLFNSVLLTDNRCDFDTHTTFGDVDGSLLTFTGLERPFYR